jgi:hypothetical protein
MSSIEIHRPDNESNEVYNFRKKFIEENIDKFDKNQIIKYSKILANMKYKKCKYDSVIYNTLKQYLC